MRSRNSDSTAPVNKMTPGKKNAARAQTASTASSEQASASPTMATPKSSDVKRGPTTRGKQIQSMESVTAALRSNNFPPETTPTVDGGKEQGGAVEGTAETKPTTRRKTIKRVVRRVVKKAPASSRVASGQPLNPGIYKQAQVEVLGAVEPEVRIQNVKFPEKEEESSVKDIEDLKTSNPQEGAKEGEELLKNELSSSENLVIPRGEHESTHVDVEPEEDIEPTLKDEKESRVKEEDKLHATAGVTAEPKNETSEMEEDPEEDMTDFDGPIEEEDREGITNEEVHDEVNQEKIPASDLQEHGGEPAALEEEHAELNAAAEERKLRKELEIFVGGLDRDVVEEDIKRVFQHAGEVVDVRLYRDPTTNKNKGYAFVRFATKEQACRALSEMRNPVIRGKRCGIAASEDNDTLFLGNICNTWTKEAIKQKLKEYGVEAVEKITLVTDPKDEGLSRGFAFLEFTSHSEAMLAYKRLQKPDVIFGHPERTAKVAFAEPLREPDPEVMSQVKSVFVDGLPPHWDEDRVREKFKQFGEIARVMLARNMSTAKRKDFGFVDFTTHGAAVACVEGINYTEFSDGNSKTRVRARLSNPLPKTQAVKGGMAGGFRIACGGGGTLPRFGGRGFGRGGHAFNRSDIQHGVDFYPHGPSQGSGRMNVAEAHESDSQYPPFYGMQGLGSVEERWGLRGAHQVRNGPPLPARPNFDRSRHGGYDPLRRQPFPSEDAFNQPFPERQFGYPRYYEDSSRGMKRPYFMEDQNPDYIEPSTRRPRFDYPEPSISHHETRYRDMFGADGGFHRQDYYRSDYERGMHPSFYGDDHPFRRGYYY